MFTHVDHNLVVQEMSADTSDKGRFYTTPSGAVLPSVTTVLSVQDKSGLDAWRKRVGEAEANRVMNQAATRGTAVHQLAEDVLSIIDYKTSRRPKRIEYVESYFIQESVYAACFYEMTGIPIKQIVTVIAVDDNEPQVFIEKPLNHLHKFVALREKYRKLKGI